MSADVYQNFEIPHFTPLKILRNALDYTPIKPLKHFILPAQKLE